MASVASTTDIRSFHVDVSEALLDDLRHRIEATRLPVAAWEEPELFAEELRAAFKSLRQGRSS